MAATKTEAKAAVETKTQAIPPIAPAMNQSANLDAHTLDLQRREAIRQKKIPELRKCLNPEYAATAEARKGVSEYRVSCVINVMEPNNQHATGKEEVVSAQNEDEAWAKFCDRIKTWPSPKWCERKIEKLN